MKRLDSTATVNVPPPCETDSPIVGDSTAMRRLRRLIREYGASDVTVLVTGETGTGKELVAQQIHRHSERASRPFRVVNCAAIPDSLFESELFGAVRGAYTGADHNRKGLVAEADEGTLLLDEIGELPLQQQAKLLRVLETGVYRPLGSDGDRCVDVRWIAATNCDLWKLAEESRFRKDLYFRLNIAQIEIPPLRERRADIGPLTDHFVRRYTAAAEPPRITPEAYAHLMSAPWPGNVRELASTIQRTLVHWHTDPVSRFDLETHDTTDGTRTPPGESLVALLMQHRGRLAPVAADLGVSARTVHRRLQKQGLRARDFRDRQQ